MTREERCFAIMRRWAAVNRVLEGFSDSERAVIADLFSGTSDLPQSAKRLGTTKERLRRVSVGYSRTCSWTLTMLPQPRPHHPTALSRHLGRLAAGIGQGEARGDGAA